MLKRILCIALVVVMALGCCACGILPGSSDGGSDSGSNSGNNSGANGLVNCKWPTSIYSRYGIPELQTANGKIVYNQFIDEGSYQYELYYNGVTREELVAWTDGLFDAGFRAHDDDKDRIKNSTYNYDIMIYMPQEQQPYRMRLSFDFGSPMTTEWYGEDDEGFTIIEEQNEYGEFYSYIAYNLTISLNPLNTAEAYEGEIEALQLKSDELKGVPGVRAVSMGQGSFMSSIDFSFYTDHLTTPDDLNACRELLIDTLAAKGFTFRHALNQEETYTADRLKSENIGSYVIDTGSGQYMLMVNQNTSSGFFGDGYHLSLSEVNR